MSKEIPIMPTSEGKKFNSKLEMINDLSQLEPDCKSSEGGTRLIEVSENGEEKIIDNPKNEFVEGASNDLDPDYSNNNKGSIDL